MDKVQIKLLNKNYPTIVKHKESDIYVIVTKINPDGKTFEGVGIYKNLYGTVHQGDWVIKSFTPFRGQLNLIYEGTNMICEKIFLSCEKIGVRNS